MKNNEIPTEGPRLALITYHSAYNYGSALQAYATQQALLSLGYKSEIVNYRMAEQKYYYTHVLSLKYGLKTLLNDLTLLPKYKERRESWKRFEEFMSRHLILTREVAEPEMVGDIFRAYDIVISGSDQIWNKNSNELRHNEWKYMDPYLLKGYGGHRISYASSVNTMSDGEIDRISDELATFDALSFREGASAKRMESILHRHVYTVLDPTLLLSGREWEERFRLEGADWPERYILCYSLGGMRADREMLVSMRKLAERRKCRLLMMTPFTHLPAMDSDVTFCHEYGPEDFLKAVYHADMVVTNSYHGTVFSVNFRKPFYSVCKPDAVDMRREDVLGRLGLEDRLIFGAGELNDMEEKPIDYAPVEERLNRLREDSLGYLKSQIMALAERR